MILRNPSPTTASSESQPENTRTTDPDEWAQLAAMTGFVPEPPPGKLKPRQHSTPSSPKVECSPESIAAPAEEPENTALLDEEDLRESEETTAKTKTPLWSDPFAKGAFVSILMASGVGSVGLLLWSINGNWSNQAENSQITASQPKATPPVDPQQAEIGRLKTIAALSSQSQTMQQDVNPAPSPGPTTVPHRLPRTAPPVRTESAPPPPITSRLPRSYTPVVRPASFPPETSSHQASAAPITPVEPMEAWQQALTAGSYGQVSSSPVPQPVETPTVETAMVETPTIAPPEADQTAIAPSPETAQLASSEQNRYDADVAAILSGRPSHTSSILPGTTTTATLSTPIMWAQDLEDNEQPQRFGVQLSEPLLAADGSVAFPAGSQMIARITTISESGMVQLAIVAVVAQTDHGNELINVPAGAILIAGEDGKPLVAEDYQPDRHHLARRDAQIALMGALGQAGTLLNRSETESTTTSPYLSSTSITNSQTNIVGGLLEGGFNALLEQAQQRQEQEVEDILQRPHIWFVPAGQPVQVFVNSSFQVSL